MFWARPESMFDPWLSWDADMTTADLACPKETELALDLTEVDLMAPSGTAPAPGFWKLTALFLTIPLVMELVKVKSWLLFSCTKDCMRD